MASSIQTEKQTKQYHMLIDLGQQLISRLDLKTVLSLITKYATDLLNSHSSVLLLTDESTHETTYASVYNVTNELLEKKLLSSESLGNQVINNKRPMVLNDYSRYPRRVALLDQYDIKAVVSVPIIWQDQAIGSLNVHTIDPEKRFEEGDIDLLLGFANYAAIAIINAKLYSDANEELRNIKILNEISHTADNRQTLQELIISLTEKIKSCYQESDYMLIVLNPFMGSFIYSSSIELSPNYVDQLKRLADEYITNQSNNSLAINLICDFSNILPFPLIRNQKVLGYLLVLNNDSANRTIQIMESIASHISVIIENALLYIQANSDLEQVVTETNSLNYAIRKITELSLSDDLKKQALDLSLFLANAKKGCYFSYSQQETCFIPISSRNMSEETKENLIEFLENFYSSFSVSKILTPEQINLSKFANIFEKSDLIKHVYILPLIFREELIGVLIIDKGDKNTKDPNFLIMRIFADIAAIAMKNADLYQNEKKIVRDARNFSGQLMESQQLLEGVFRIHNELLREVLNSSTIARIAEIVYHHADNPLLVEDSVGNALAECPWQYGVSTIHSKLSDANFTEWYFDLLKEKKPTSYKETEDVLRYVVPLVAGEKIVGFLSMLANVSDFTQWQKHIIGSSALAFSMAIVNANRTLEIEQSFKNEVLEVLIDEKYLQSKEDILRRANHMGLCNNGNYRLIVIDFYNYHPAQTIAATEQPEPSLFEKRFIMESLSAISQLIPAKFFFISNPQGITVAYPTNGDSKDQILQLCSLFMGDFFTRYRKAYPFVIGVSSEVTGLLNFRKGFLEACKCVVIGRLSNNLNKPTYFEDTGLLGFLFHEENEQLLTDFVVNQIGPLIDHDKKGTLSLVDTLECYLDNDCKLMDTAEGLYIHVNTLKYRLKKIKDIISIDTNKTDQRVNLYAACKIFRMFLSNKTRSSI